MTAASAAADDSAGRMAAVRVHAFGGIESLHLETAPRPLPGSGQVLVQVKAAGVGPWDAWVRQGQSKVSQALPLTPGAEFSGIVESVGPDVTTVRPGDAVFGATNARFTGGYAEYALADADRIAAKPQLIGHIEAASIPVVAVTAWQMVHHYGQADRTKRILIHGAAGNVGAYAVQFALRAGSYVIAAVHNEQDAAYVRALGADEIIDTQSHPFDTRLRNVDVDVVIDTVGGETLARSLAVLKPGGIVVSAVAPPNEQEAARRGVRAAFFIVDITSGCLKRIAALLDAGVLRTHVGEVLPLTDARLAHEMLAGAPHQPGKIVLTVGSPRNAEQQ